MATEKVLIDKINVLEEEITSLKERLKKYTNPDRRKKYYENHKEEMIAKNIEYKKKVGYKQDKEKQKEYNKKYYENRKQKSKNEELEIKSDEVKNIDIKE